MVGLLSNFDLILSERILLFPNPPITENPFLSSLLGQNLLAIHKDIVMARLSLNLLLILLPPTLQTFE